jgi:hypothetical protein
VKAAKSQQILPSDRKHVDLVGIGARKKEVSQSFSQPLQGLAEDALRRFTRVRRLAVGRETEDSRKSPRDAAANHLTMSRRENLAIRPTHAQEGLLHGVVH